MKTLRKFIIGVIGILILIAGIVSIFIPTPALLLIPLGLLVLASEFVLVRKLIQNYSRQIRKRYCSGNPKGSICLNITRITKKLEKGILKMSKNKEAQ